MKRLALVAVIAVLTLTGCAATTASPKPETKESTGSVTVAPPTVATSDDDTSSLAAILSDSEIFAKAGLPDFTVPGGTSGPLSLANYNTQLRQYKGGLDQLSDRGLNTVSNTLCYGVKNGAYPTIRDGLKGGGFRLSSLQALQLMTLIVAQYCPSQADKIAG